MRRMEGNLRGNHSYIVSFIGPDAGAHMSEELKDASVVLPKAMMWATFFNGIFGIIMMITFVFGGGALDCVLDSATGAPVLQAVYNATGSKAGTVVMGSLLVILTFFAAVSVCASASRSLWARQRSTLLILDRVRSSRVGHPDQSAPSLTRRFSGHRLHQLRFRGHTQRHRL
jgi:amino acid transporter